MSYDLEEMLKKVVVSTADPGEPKVNIDLDKPLNQSESLSFVCVCDRSVCERRCIKEQQEKIGFTAKLEARCCNVNASFRV